MIVIYKEPKVKCATRTMASVFARSAMAVPDAINVCPVISTIPIANRAIAQRWAVFRPIVMQLESVRVCRILLENSVLNVVRATMRIRNVYVSLVLC